MSGAISPVPPPTRVVIVGAGPAGLMAADVVSAQGHAVVVLERMPTAGRKLMLAGRGGLNLTHSEALEPFLARYGETRDRIRPIIEAFPPSDLVRFAEDLGQATFVGSSGRVFPKAMKASPLLRSWLARLVARGVDIRTRHRWTGLAPDGAVLFEDRDGKPGRIEAAALVLALGGASWPRLGADGVWQSHLAEWGVKIAPLQPSNCGVLIPWSAHLVERFSGKPLKRIAIFHGGVTVRGEALITAAGLEGGAVYALGPGLRAALQASGTTVIHLDLRPDMTHAEVAARLAKPQGKASLANWLRKALGLDSASIALLHEAAGRAANARLASDPADLAARIKAVPLEVTGLADLTRAISTAGGVCFGEVDETLMLRRRPGVFVAGEMLDWDAPTGGYLLQATFASGVVAGRGVIAFLARRQSLIVTGAPG